MRIRTTTIFIMLAVIVLFVFTIFYFLPRQKPTGVMFIFENNKSDAQPIKLGREYRTALECPVPGKLIMDAEIPASASLSFGYGLASRPKQKELAPVFFRLFLDDGKQEHMIFERTLNEYGNWKEARVDLDSLSQKEIQLRRSKLVFETQIKSSENEESLIKPRAFWADPILIDSNRPSQKRPNVILVSIDTLRADHLHCYGYHRKDISPFMDSMAEKGILFDQAISQCPWTTPSHASIFTGLYPSSHGVNQTLFLLIRARRNKEINSTYQGLDPDIATIASKFRGESYITQAFCGGGTVSGDIGFAHSHSGYVEIDFAKESTKVVKKWIDEHKDLPFYLFLHTFRVHAPYKDLYYAHEVLNSEQTTSLQDFFENADNVIADQPAKLEQLGALRKQVTETLYDGGIHETDKKLEDIVAHLEEIGLLDSTIIVITSDHGEEFGEHSPDEIYDSHGKTLYDEIIRVPLILYNPTSEYAGEKIKNQVRLIDLFPTLCDLADIKYHKADIQGKSLISLVQGKENRSRDALSEAIVTGPEKKSIRRSDSKYIYTFKIKDNTLPRDLISRHPGYEEFYMLDEDPDEKENLAAANPNICLELRELINKAITHKPASVRHLEFNIKIEKDTEEKLKSLGYIR
ncbi:MAG: sulfatase [Acidobacteriota bacterium]